MSWCLTCQAKNTDDATVCSTCGAPMPQTPRWWKAISQWKYVAALILGIGGVSAYIFWSRQQDAEHRVEPSFARCRENGERYYKDMGMWPTLSDGRSAEGAVIDKCDRSWSAF